MQLKGRRIYKGKAEGEALVSKQSISFYGGVDPSTGTIVERGHELEGKSITGKILVFPMGKGSTVGSYVLYRMSKNGKGPKGLVLKECEAIVAVGCIIGEIPCIDHVDIEKLTTGEHLILDANEAALELK
jgi:predicted aconitase with swiveling domain